MGLLWLFFWAGLFSLVVGSILIAVELLRPRRRTFARALAKNIPTDPGQLGWTFEEVSFRLCDDSLTPGWIITGQQPQGPVLVACHGWGESRYDMLPRFLPWLSQVSHIIVYDQRGHGESQARLCRLGEWEVRDLGCILEQLESRLGKNPRVLLGCSMGAGVVMQWAAGQNPQDVQAVVVEGACPRLRIALAGILRSLHLPAWPMAWIAPWLVTPWAWGVAWLDHRCIVAKLPCPFWVLHGQQDSIAPIQHARELAQQARHGTFVAFPQAGHLGLAEQDEKRYVDTLNKIFGHNNPPKVINSIQSAD